MLVVVRGLAAPALDALHESVDVRLRGVRVGLHRGRNVATDFTLLERAAPFVHRVQRSTLTLVFEGSGRVDEAGRQRWMREGEMVTSDANRGGTEAYAGVVTSRLVVDWDPEIIGARISGPCAIDRVREPERARLRGAARRLASDRPYEAAADVLAILRALGMPFGELEPEAVTADFASLSAALHARLSRLEAQPDMEELADELRWNRKRVTRRLATMADHYALPWTHWRTALHSARMLHAMRLLAAPGATTELVARLAGFRAPAALCHAFAEAGWPSPGALARAARGEALVAWTGTTLARST